MLARLLFVMHLVALLAGMGCCCQPLCNNAMSCGDPCGGSACNTCCLSFPKPIVWTGELNDCGPGPCESCADCSGECGLLPFLRRSKVCGKGCGEVYWGEWVSDPPDCCDPCDPCYGCYTGSNGGCCNLGPCQRLLAALHGYSYCPKPNCGPVCGLCNKSGCGGCGGCGETGCTSCGHGGFEGAHGADVYYDGPMESPGHPHQGGHGQSIMEENWDIPKTRPIPGKPIHNAQQPRGQYTQRGPAPTKRQGNQRVWMTQPPTRRPTPSLAKQPTPNPRQVSRTSQPIGTGVRPAGYQR